jgi:hypothetical protein
MSVSSECEEDSVSSGGVLDQTTQVMSQFNFRVANSDIEFLTGPETPINFPSPSLLDVVTNITQLLKNSSKSDVQKIQSSSKSSAAANSRQNVQALTQFYGNVSDIWIPC